MILSLWNGPFLGDMLIFGGISEYLTERAFLDPFWDNIYIRDMDHGWNLSTYLAILVCFPRRIKVDSGG